MKKIILQGTQIAPVPNKEICHCCGRIIRKDIRFKHTATFASSGNFDIAGLIEKGDVIDINTLQGNPYK